MAIYDSSWEQLLKRSQPTSFSDATVFDIFLRLPIKSILRFKSLCKKWYALCGDSRFIYAHLNRSVESSDCCYLIQKPLRYEETVTLRTLFFLSDEKIFEEMDGLYYNPKISCGWKIVASIHGIVCFIKFDYRADYYCILLDILLWNPATRELRILPKFPSIHLPVTCVNGFGFDSKNNDYKVVAICQSKDSSKVNIYSLRTDSWRVVDSNNYELQQSLPTVYVNGKMHWFEGIGSPRVQIVSFDLAEEKFIVMDLPKIEYLNHSPRLLECPAGLGNSLILSTCKVEVGCQIWFMKKYGDSKSWIKLYNFPLDPVYGNRALEPYNFLDNGMIIMQNDNITLLWSPKDQVREVLNVDRFRRVVKYKESMMSVRRGGSICNHNNHRAGTINRVALSRNGVDG